MVIYRFFVCLFIYYFIMDIITYTTLQNITLTDQSRNGSFSIFHPLTAKLIMSDHANHYVFVLMTEYFEDLTGFSRRLNFIKANMVTIAHLVVSLIAAKYVSSDCLYDRRKGVLLYELKMWLDSLDGVIYRSHSNDRVYRSRKGTLGYFMDGITDIISGISLCIGVVVFLIRSQRSSQNDDTTLLPLTEETNGSNYSNRDEANVDNNEFGKCSKRKIVWKCWCYGFQLLIACISWDKRIEEAANVLETDLKSKQQTILQTSMLHSFSTWCMMYLWRLFCGQSFLQVFLAMIFINKVWEFLNVVQYVGYLVLIAVNIISVIHIEHMKAVIGMK